MTVSEIPRPNCLTMIFRRLCRSVHSSSVGNRILTVFVPSAERSWIYTCRVASNTAFFCSSMLNLYWQMPSVLHCATAERTPLVASY